MARPTKIGFFEGPQVNANATNDLEENTEVRIGRKKQITVRVNSGDPAAGQQTGLLIRYFARVDGIPVATFVLFSNVSVNGAQVDVPKDVRVIRGTSQSLRAIAWDRKNPIQGAGDVLTKRVRIRAREALRN